MKKVLVVLMVTLFGPSFASANSEVLGFSAWKAMRVEEAKSALERIQNEVVPERGIPAMAQAEPRKSGLNSLPRVQKGGKGESRLQQAQLNFEVATELTINDYFVLYLGTIREESAIFEAAKKMSADEVAQLMLAYKKQLESSYRQSNVGLLPSTSRVLSPSVNERITTGDF